MEVLRPRGLAARSELEALWRCCQPAASWRLYGGVEAARAGARSELEALWRC